MKAHQSFRLSAVLCFANGFLVIEYRLRVGGFGHVSGPHVRSITGIQARAYGKVVVGEGGPQIPPRIFELLSRIVQVDPARTARHLAFCDQNDIAPDSVNLSRQPNRVRDVQIYPRRSN